MELVDILCERLLLFWRTPQLESQMLHWKTVGYFAPIIDGISLRACIAEQPHHVGVIDPGNNH